jgi:hypothetical protein
MVQGNKIIPLAMYFQPHPHPSPPHQKNWVLARYSSTQNLGLVIQDVRKRLYLFQKFLFLWAPDVIFELELERRVYQSKLGVSSSNQCNLHHFPHNGHLEKKYTKGSIFFGHPV